MQQSGRNLYPDTTAHRAHLKGQERAEAYILQKRDERIHYYGRMALVLSLIAFAAFQIVRVL